MKNSTTYTKNIVSHRIDTIIRQLKHKNVADIGCDHGYTSIYACLGGFANNVIACDINQGPLSVATKNIQEHGLSEHIQTRLGSGLQPLHAGEVDSIIISGMGGELIVRILQEGSHITPSLKQMILSPQSNMAKVREFVHSIGYTITDEIFIEENAKYYNIIMCEQGKEEPYTQGQYFLGKILIDKKEELFVNYVQESIDKLLKIRERLSEENKKEIDKKIEIYKTGL